MTFVFPFFNLGPLFDLDRKKANSFMKVHKSTCKTFTLLCKVKVYHTFFFQIRKK